MSTLRNFEGGIAEFAWGTNSEKSVSKPFLKIGESSRKKQ